MLYLKKDKFKDGAAGFMLFLLCLGGCKGKGSSSPPTIVETVTTLLSASISSPHQSNQAPDINQLRSASGSLQFASGGSYAHSLNFSNGKNEGAIGSYVIQADGKMITDLFGGSLPGAVNPEEDFLYQADVQEADGSVGITMAASAANFPADAWPDFSGSYSFLGIRFLYPGAGAQDLNQSVRMVLGAMSIVQDQDLGGSFFVNGNDSSGNSVLRQGTFTIQPSDLSLAFYLDGFPGEIWLGSFSPSGLIVLSDTNLGNGDSGSYAAVYQSAFSGTGPFAFDGIYRVAQIRYQVSPTLPFRSEILGRIRNFNGDGNFSDDCDPQLPCPGIALNPSPYLLNADGSLTLNDPFLISATEGSITGDLGAFVAVQMGGSGNPAYQEATFSVGVRLVP